MKKIKKSQNMFGSKPINLAYVIPDRIYRRQLTEEERVEFLKMQIENSVEYIGNEFQCQLYCKMKRQDSDGNIECREIIELNRHNNLNIVSVQYWGIHEGKIYTLGMGGYIPEFHPKNDRIYEFGFKTFEFKLPEEAKIN